MRDNVSVESLSSTKKKISIWVSGEEINKEIDSFVSSTKDKIHIKGFRKGKAPINVVKNHLSEQIKQSVSQSVLAKFYSQAIKDNNIKQVSGPQAMDKENPLGKFDVDNSYSIDLSVDVIPDVAVKDYENLEIVKQNINSDEEVDKEILSYRERFAAKKPIDSRPAQATDTVVIDVISYIDGEEFPDGNLKDYIINNLGRDKLIENIDDKIIGMEINQTINMPIEFPSDYNITVLANKKVEFNITLKSIIENQLAEVDNDLALLMGYDSVEAMLSTVRTDIEEKVKSKQFEAVANQVVEKLVEKNQFEIPTSMIKGEFDRLLSMVRQNGLKQLDQKVAQLLSNRAEFNVRKYILLDALFNQEQLEITPEELDDYLDKSAAANNKDKNEFISLLQNSKQMDAFMSELRAKKSIEFVISKQEGV